MAILITRDKTFDIFFTNLSLKSYMWVTCSHIHNYVFCITEIILYIFFSILAFLFLILQVFFSHSVEYFENITIMPTKDIFL